MVDSVEPKQLDTGSRFRPARRGSGVGAVFGRSVRVRLKISVHSQKFLQPLVIDVFDRIPDLFVVLFVPLFDALVDVSEASVDVDTCRDYILC